MGGEVLHILIIQNLEVFAKEKGCDFDISNQNMVHKKQLFGDLSLLVHTDSFLVQNML